MLSVGMSNTNAYFCGSKVPEVPSDDGSFMDQAAADPTVDASALKIVNGTRPAASLGYWLADSTEFDRILSSQLQPQGLTEAQVQVIWVLNVNALPNTSLPDAGADVYSLVAGYGQLARQLKSRYPNVQQVFFSSRIYGGYATTPLNPEPYAYESGFAVKWLIEAQIDQMNGAGVDPIAGDLDFQTAAPWIAWGAYMWADGDNSRDDGLTWEQADFGADGTHPSEQGVIKAGGLLLNFFKTSPFAWPWFLAHGSTPEPTLSPTATAHWTATPTPSATPVDENTATPTPTSPAASATPAASMTSTPPPGGGPGAFRIYLSVIREEGP